MGLLGDSLQQYNVLAHDRLGRHCQYDKYGLIIIDSKQQISSNALDFFQRFFSLFKSDDIPFFLRGMRWSRVPTTRMET